MKQSGGETFYILVLENSGEYIKTGQFVFFPACRMRRRGQIVLFLNVFAGKK